MAEPTKNETNKTDLPSKQLTPEFGAGLLDSLQNILADIVQHGATRTAAKSAAITVADRYVRYAETTPSKLDDIFAHRIRAEVDEHFVQWYDYFLSLVGMVPTDAYASGEPVYGCPVVPDLIEMKQMIDQPSPFLGDVAKRFGVSVNQVKQFIELIAPLVIQWFLKTR